MTDISSTRFAQRVGKGYAAQSSRFDVEETYWGYIIRPTDGPRLSMQIMQAAALIFGSMLAAVASGLLVIPEVIAGNVDFAIRTGAAIICGGLAAFLLWFASRGTEIELHIDTGKGEIRENVRNKAGRSTLLGRYGFDAIGGVHIDRSDPNPSNAALVMRYRNTSQKLPVAFGRVQDLEPLKDRLGQDLIVGVTALR